MEAPLTFAEYLRARRRTYTEGAYQLRQAIIGMPPEVQTRNEVYAWLAETGAHWSVQTQVRIAADGYSDCLNRRRKRGLIVAAAAMPR